MRYLLDTNIISELRKKTPDPKVISWLENVDSEDLYLSAITIGELKCGAIKKDRTDKVQAKALHEWINSIVKEYHKQILSFGFDESEIWAKLIAQDNTNAVDSLIASQALVNGMVLVTRNTKHFRRLNVKLFNPFNVEEEHL